MAGIGEVRDTEMSSPSSPVHTPDENEGGGETRKPTLEEEIKLKLFLLPQSGPVDLKCPATLCIKSSYYRLELRSHSTDLNLHTKTKEFD